MWNSSAQPETIPTNKPTNKHSTILWQYFKCMAPSTGCVACCLTHWHQLLQQVCISDFNTLKQFLTYLHWDKMLYSVPLLNKWIQIICYKRHYGKITFLVTGILRIEEWWYTALDEEAIVLPEGRHWHTTQYMTAFDSLTLLTYHLPSPILLLFWCLYPDTHIHIGP